MAGIDKQVIQIDLSLGVNVEQSFTHRKFACVSDSEELGGLTDGLLITLGTYQSIIDDALTPTKDKDALESYFSGGGQEIRWFTTFGALETYKECEEGNVLLGLAGGAAQQVAAYESFSLEAKDPTTGKGFYFNLTGTENETLPAGLVASRNVFAGYEIQKELFWYVGSYNVEFGTRQNSLEQYPAAFGYSAQDSAVRLINREKNLFSIYSLDSIGDPIFMDTGDTTGLLLNWWFLKGDLESRVRANQLSTLITGNDYNQTTINLLEADLKLSAKRYIDNITIFTTTQTPFTQQLATDIIAGIVRGFTLTYAPRPEIKEVYNNIIERIS